MKNINTLMLKFLDKCELSNMIIALIEVLLEFKKS